MSDIFAICKVVQQQIILTTAFLIPPTILRIRRELTFDTLDYRISLVSLISLPLGLGMLGVGGASLASCSGVNVSQIEIASEDRHKSQADFIVVRHLLTSLSLQSNSLTEP